MTTSFSFTLIKCGVYSIICRQHSTEISRVLWRRLATYYNWIKYKVFTLEFHLYLKKFCPESRKLQLVNEMRNGGKWSRDIITIVRNEDTRNISWCIFTISQDITLNIQITQDDDISYNIAQDFWNNTSILINFIWTGVYT